MKKEDFITLGASEALAAKCESAFAQAQKEYIPKARFNEVNESKKQLEAELKSRDEQLEALKGVNADGLKEELERLQADNRAATEQHRAELAKVVLESAIEKSLLAVGAKNLKAVKALLDTDALKLSENGEVEGLGKQLAALQKGADTDFLFRTTHEAGTNFRGVNPAERRDGTPGNAPPTTLAGALKQHLTQ